MLIKLLLLGCCVTAGATTLDHERFADKSLVKVLFGSCNSQRLKSPLWPHIIERKPDIWIFGGDNMYADRMLKDPLGALLRFQLPFEEANETDLLTAYKTLLNTDGYRKLLATGVEQIAIWDDHDYGINDGDKTYPLKEASRKIFLSEMVKAPKDDPRWTQKGGIYLAKKYNVQSKDSTFRIIALDVRYSKDPWSDPIETADMLGVDQWKWLETELCSDESPRVNIIVSGLQVLPENRGAGEAWAKFPNSRQRLFDLLGKCRVKAPIILSGDVHMSELFEATCKGASFSSNTLVELTSSGMTHSWATRSPGWVGEYFLFNAYLAALMNVAQVTMPWNYRSIRAKGAQPEGAFYLGLNFGEIDLDFEKQELTAQVIGAKNQPVLVQTWKFEELDVKEATEHLDCEPRRGKESRIQLWFARGLVIFMFFVLPITVIVLFPYYLARRILC